MRRIGTLNNGTHARRFCQFLVTLSIDATTDSDEDPDAPVWNIWIRDEQDVERARQELETFRQSPEDTRYQVEGEVAKIRNEQIAEQQRRLKQQRKLVQSMPAQRSGFGPMAGGSVRQQSIYVTITIIICSVIASFSTNFGSPRRSRPGNAPMLEQKVFDALTFVNAWEYAKTKDAYADLRRGQVWRIFTPMLLHGSPMHLAFNMLWIYFLGSALERLQGSLFFVLLTLGTHTVGMFVTTVTSTMDFLPEALQGHPISIGASGAVYGLFGYLWIRPLVDPSYPIRLVPMNIAIMLGWLVLCMISPIGSNVANGAHLGGLVAGIAVAMIGMRRDHG